MHDLLNKILNIVLLVVHTIVQLFFEKKKDHKIADYDHRENEVPNLKKEVKDDGTLQTRHSN